MPTGADTKHLTEDYPLDCQRINTCPEVLRCVFSVVNQALRKDLNEAQMFELNRQRAAELGEACLSGQYEGSFGKIMCGKTGKVV